ncbi:MAG: hypothetical protein FWF78_02755 [Defluviitaleaceae bacterium]|nr:hypothetical protein [Defluviitaleaceae bacterium]
MECGIDFSSYYDGEADNAEKISAHLADCIACAREYDDFVRFMSEIKSLPEPLLPSGFSDVLLRAVHHDVCVRRRRRKNLTFGQFSLVAAASVLFAVVVGIMGFDTAGDGFEYMASSIEIQGLSADIGGGWAFDDADDDIFVRGEGESGFDFDIVESRLRVLHDVQVVHDIQDIPTQQSYQSFVGYVALAVIAVFAVVGVIFMQIRKSER